MRKVLKLSTTNNRDEIWEDLEFKSLKTGDIFVLYENDGNLVRDINKECMFQAISNAYLSDDNKTYRISYSAYVSE